MPYKSQAQQRYMHAAAARGEIKPSVVKEFDSATNFSKLPRRKKTLEQAKKDRRAAY